MFRLGNLSSSNGRLLRRALLDGAIGFAVFIVLAFGVSIDRTGGVGGFTNIGHLVSADARAADYAPIVNQADRSHVSSAVVVESQAKVTSAKLALARMNQPTAMVILGLMFSIFVAFKLAFLRHLRAVYSRGQRRRFTGKSL